MKNASDYQLESLGEWVVIATMGLVAPARERIKLEIEAHYADAVKSNLGLGLTQEDAESAALLELGDPKTAAKSFRRRHLTPAEAQLLNRTLESYEKWKSSGRYWRTVIISVLTAVFCFLMLSLSGSHGHRSFYLIMCIASLAIVPEYIISARFLLRKQGTTGEVSRRLIAHEVLSAAVTLFFLTGAMFTLARDPVLVVLVWLLLVLPVPGLRLAKKVRLWLKLRHAHSGDGTGLEA